MKDFIVAPGRRYIETENGIRIFDCQLLVKKRFQFSFSTAIKVFLAVSLLLGILCRTVKAIDSGPPRITLTPSGTAAGNTGEVHWLELRANGANYIGLKAPDAVTANKVFIFPDGDGTNNQALATDGALQFKWITPILSGGAAGGDLTGTYPNPTIANNAVTTAKILDANVTAAKMVNAGVFNSDASGTFPSVNVIKANGASIPAAGALVTGNGLYASGVTALTYSALNLSGGTGWISGVTPIINGGTNSSIGLAGGRSIISSSGLGIVESNGYSKKTAVGPYTIVVADNHSIIDADASSNAVGFTLPAAANTNVGFRVTIRRIDFNHVANAVTITPNGADGIDGRGLAVADTLNSNATNAQYASETLVSTGAAGNGAGQGWIVERSNDWMGATVSAQTGYTSTTAKTMCSVALTPGEWDVSGIGVFVSGNNNTTQINMSIVATTPGLGTDGDNQWDDNATHATGIQVSASIPSYRVVVTANTTWVLAATMTFAGTSPTVYGRISARRVR